VSVYGRIRPLLFRLDPEDAHSLTLHLLALSGALPPVRAILRGLFRWTDPSLRTRAFGLDFPNPVGMAAGYDKDGRGLSGLACLGFGHLELGTVTPKAQPGNPRPRIFRLPEDKGLINRMGFPNEGAEPLLRRLQRGRPKDVVIGVNIGKGADTPLEAAAEDYLSLMRSFYADTDYLAVNVSSPNTLGLRRLQARQALELLLGAVAAERAQLQATSGRRVPVLVKLAPDLSNAELEDAVGAIQGAGLEGVIATNTTLDRTGLISVHRDETGGLSGVPLRRHSTEIIRAIARITGGRLAIVGAGGIFCAEDAREKLDAGASLIQVYTGLVYRGPGLVREILQGLTASR
jgi:dihydroorotate dehydrogenase